MGRFSDNVIQISSGINSVLIHCDLIDGAYNDGIKTNKIQYFHAAHTQLQLVINSIWNPKIWFISLCQEKPYTE